MASSLNVTQLTASVEKVGFVPEPDGRGTMGLIHGCFSTIIICTWSALHLNLPADEEKWVATTCRKLKWMAIAIFAPEFIASTAVRELLEARWILKQIQPFNVKVWRY